MGYYKNISDEKKEFDRKVRTVLRGISVLMRNLSLLNPFKYGLFSWQLFSHKLCRWLVPFFMIFAFISNAAIFLTSDLLFVLFLLQLGFYGLAIYYHKQTKHAEKHAVDLIKNSKLKTQNSIGSIQNSKFKIQNLIGSIAKLPYFFVTVNISIAVAWWKYLKGERSTFWAPSNR